MGGAQQLLEMLCKSLEPPEFKHCVICLGGDTELAKKLRNSGIKVICLNITRAYQGIYGIWRLRRILSSEQPQIIHTWLYHADLMATVAMIGRGTSLLLWSVHHANENFTGDNILTKWIVKLLAMLSGSPAAIIYCSQYAKQVHQEFGYKPRICLVINNGVDTQRFSPSSQSRSRFRSQYGLGSTTPVIGMVARYSPVKGHKVFLEMARDLCALNSEVRFVMLGTDIDTNNPELSRTLEDFGLRDRCLLLGELADVEIALNGMDVLVCPSYSESFGLVVVEALACSVPVVCSDLEVLQMLVGSEYTVPVGDSSAFVEKVSGLIAIEDAGRKEIGRKGRERMVQEFDVKTMIKHYNNLYRETCPES